MNTKGYVYVLSNPAFSWLKIGYSKNGGHVRAKDLSKETGVPLPYDCDYELEVDDARFVEGEVHKELDQYRVNRGKEFFNCSVETAIECIERLQNLVAPITEKTKPKIKSSVEYSVLEAEVRDLKIQNLELSRLLRTNIRTYCGDLQEPYFYGFKFSRDNTDILSHLCSCYVTCHYGRHHKHSEFSFYDPAKIATSVGVDLDHVINTCKILESMDLIFLCGDEGGNGLFKVNELALNWAKASDIL